ISSETCAATRRTCVMNNIDRSNAVRSSSRMSRGPDAHKSDQGHEHKETIEGDEQYRWQLADVRARGVGLGKAHGIPRLQTKGAEEHENAASGQNDGLHHHLAKGGFGPTPAARLAIPV